MLVTFYVLAIIILAAAVATVTLKNVFRSALALALVTFTIAGLYLLLNAEFVAAVQVLIYVGAITVLIIFAVMLTQKIYDKSIRQTNEQVGLTAIVTVALLGLLISTLTRTRWPTVVVEKIPPAIPKIGELLLTQYVLPFEVASVVLLVALIGAIVIAKKDD